MTAPLSERGPAPLGAWIAAVVVFAVTVFGLYGLTVLTIDVALSLFGVPD